MIDVAINARQSKVTVKGIEGGDSQCQALRLLGGQPGVAGSLLSSTAGTGAGDAPVQREVGMPRAGAGSIPATAGTAEVGQRVPGTA